MIKRNSETNSIDFRFFNLKISVKKKNYFRKLYSLLLRKFSFCFPIRRLYDYIVPIGDNCKYSTTFHHFYKFNDSTLLNWAEICEKKYLEEIIKYPESIYSEGFTYMESRNMWMCNKYKIAFHGRSLPQELLTDGVLDENKKQEDFEELQSRLKYLIEKTRNIFASQEKKLFVFTYEENDFDGDINFLKNIYNLLHSMSSNFDFLIIYRSEDKIEEIDNLQNELQNCFVRRVSQKDENVGWAKINCEFVPKFRKKQTKKRKFELLD